MRELQRREVENLPRGRMPIAMKLRESHHVIARLFAMGLRRAEIAERSGYSISRINILAIDPAFKELVKVYLTADDQTFVEKRDEYYELIRKNGMLAELHLHDRLTDEEKELSPRELVMISRDAADRVGYSKHHVQHNVNHDLEARLARAMLRSGKIINHGPASPGPLPEPAATSLPVARAPALIEGEVDPAPPTAPNHSTSPSPIRRRA